MWSSHPLRTVLGLLSDRVASDPDGPFLDVCGTRFTAAQADREANRVANALIAAGVRPGDRVATLLDNSPEGAIAFYATLKAGAVYVPVNTALKGLSLRHQMTDADAAVMIVGATYAERVTPDVLGSSFRRAIVVGDGGRCDPALTWTAWDGFVSANEGPTGISPKPADDAIIIYTGGTTGPSKGCALSHNYAVCMPESNVVTWGRDADDVVWTPLPLFHFNALGVCLIGTLIAGGSAVITDRFSVSRFWEDVTSSEATIASLLGSPVVMIARAPDHPLQPGGGPGSNTTLRLMTGAPMPPEVDAILRERFGLATFSNAYGTTEVSLVSWLPPGVPARAGSAGVVNSDSFDVRIFDDDDVELPIGSQGEIVVRPRRPLLMFSGYWRNPAATVRDSRNHWWHTGDVGRIDADGYLYFVDRKADYLRRRGENVSTWEVEQTFHEHPAVADVAVVGVPSPVGEDDIKVTVVLKADVSMTEQELWTWSLDHLPRFAVPRYVEFRDDLPRSETGRITKAPLRAEGVTARSWDFEAAGLVIPR